jgi:hypothetical protein
MTAPQGDLKLGIVKRVAVLETPSDKQRGAAREEDELPVYMFLSDGKRRGRNLETWHGREDCFA